MLTVEAAKEHVWLRKFVGEWAYEGHADQGPDGKPMDFSGRESVRAIGDYWIQGESTGTCPGVEEATMILSLGFSPEKGRFTGSWFGSMMPNFFVYEGWLENDDKRLVLETEGTCPMEPGKTRTFRDITDFVSDDHRHFHAEMKNDDGTWTTLMRMDFTRVK